MKKNVVYYAYVEFLSEFASIELTTSSFLYENFGGIGGEIFVFRRIDVFIGGGGIKGGGGGTFLLMIN